MDFEADFVSIEDDDFDIIAVPDTWFKLLSTISFHSESSISRTKHQTSNIKHKI